ncbi:MULTISPECIES: hypothetical protein [unclassified Carboxylicivirga]|uniref:hypothetical protein n=1 Tax=Carboxylicivirga TaxID=1628153 RepID=UPI003D33156C
MGASIRVIAVSILLLIIGTTHLGAQCISFAKKVGKEQLGDYLHDGNYNATVLGEGEKAELYKTFFSSQRYRIAVAKVDQLPDIRLRILDQAGNVLFDNADHDYVLVWDFRIVSTQMLVVELTVLEHDTESDTLMSGCVSVLFGMESDQKKKKR